MQPGWGKVPNRGWCTDDLNDPLERLRGPRVPSVGTPADQGKGMGATSTPMGVEWPKAVAVVVQSQGLGGGGAGHHDDRNSGGMGRQLSATKQG
jgi:hypothetical protein